MQKESIHMIVRLPERRPLYSKICQKCILNFGEKLLRIVGLKNLSFFESAILIFFLLHPHLNQAQNMG